MCRPEIVTAIWGIETSYGANRGRAPILATLATLAKDGRRAAFFEGELIAALRMVQMGKVTPARFTGSWAGGFLDIRSSCRSSYLTYAVPFAGNGVADVWADDPSDALASAANYLGAAGLDPWPALGRRGGVAARLRPWRNRANGRADWGRSGRDSGARHPAPGAVAAYPARRGRAAGPFLATGNYDGVERITTFPMPMCWPLGHLSDRLSGFGAFCAGMATPKTGAAGTGRADRIDNAILTATRPRHGWHRRAARACHHCGGSGVAKRQRGCPLMATLNAAAAVPTAAQAVLRHRRERGVQQLWSRARRYARFPTEPAANWRRAGAGLRTAPALCGVNCAKRRPCPICRSI